MVARVTQLSVGMKGNHSWDVHHVMYTKCIHVHYMYTCTCTLIQIVYCYYPDNLFFTPLSQCFHLIR